ncbi:hypothetical protein DIURU_000432 [Diutina rugosa]|uniref:SRP9 domain-containing protein n=1 Tax=Diutina rugosa TaxID=5481 RepID=A0A642V4P0_DIURU|nr:uncharacterized protein DIURU_000432 [Diutina rugosa]KAA8907745.1 hypothetical protein DIURU_000432 [Diutina rugosa]
MDAFIESSTKLLAAYPSTTVSITYSNQHKKNPNKVAKPASNKVSVKLYVPEAGKIVKYSTFKSKELSKILALLGPFGVAMASTNPQIGLAGIMANVAMVEATPEPEPAVVEPSAKPAAADTPVVESKKKKNKKKKKR